LPACRSVGYAVGGATEGYAYYATVAGIYATYATGYDADFAGSIGATYAAGYRYANGSVTVVGSGYQSGPSLSGS